MTGEANATSKAPFAGERPEGTRHDSNGASSIAEKLDRGAGCTGTKPLRQVEAAHDGQSMSASWATTLATAIRKAPRDTYTGRIPSRFHGEPVTDAGVNALYLGTWAGRWRCQRRRHAGRRSARLAARALGGRRQARRVVAGRRLITRSVRASYRDAAGGVERVARDPELRRGARPPLDGARFSTLARPLAASCRASRARAIAASATAPTTR